jgi:hypothetical protein
MHLGTPHTPEERAALRNTPAAGEERLRRQVLATVENGKHSCASIQRIVDNVGFAALSTQLGVNAGDIQASYNAIRTLVVALAPATVIPDLNTGA